MHLLFDMAPFQDSFGEGVVFDGGFCCKPWLRGEKIKKEDREYLCERARFSLWDLMAGVGEVAPPSLPDSLCAARWLSKESHVTSFASLRGLVDRS